MNRSDADRTVPHVAAQAAASWTVLDRAARDEALAAALLNQEKAFRDAQGELQVVKDFIGVPEHILGNPSTKHGEIAEQVHVAVRRASDLLHQRMPAATFEGVGRLDAVDYVDGVEVQSKYYNGLHNTLDAITAHAKQYPDFAIGTGRYHMPRDQLDQLRQLREAGTIVGLSSRSVERIQRMVGSLEEESGRSIGELIEFGEATYAEVQQGRIHDTIENREQRLSERNEELKDEAIGEHGPTFAGAATAAAFGAAAGAGVRFAQAVWVKYRDGKNPLRGEFSVEDWTDIGLGTVKGAGGGAVASGMLYLMTNATELSAPFAGALVSGLMGIGKLLGHYRAGKIDGAQFVDLALLVSSDAAIVGLAAMAGQTLIPLPMLGAFVGIIAGKFVTSAIRDGFGGIESGLAEQIDVYETQAIAKLDEALCIVLDRLDSRFGQLEDLASIAFDDRANTELRLATSIQIAEAVDVPKQQILRSSSDLDTFMQG